MGNMNKKLLLGNRRDVGVDVIIILKWILEIQRVKLWIGFNWLITGLNGGL
jgi:hypothetical protein